MIKEATEGAHHKSLKEVAGNALFASIINSSDDAILSKTLDGKITSWNQGAEKVFGYTKSEIIGKHISMLIPPHLQNEEKQIIEKISKGEFVDHYETERIRKDGKVIYVSLTISPIKDEYGNITGASKISRDITERKRAEEKIIKSRRLYAFLSQINQSIVKIKDEQQLLNSACSIALEFGLFKSAWIGLLDEKGLLKIAAIEGNAAVTKELMKLSGLDYKSPEFCNTTTGLVLNTGQFDVKNDIENDMAMKPFKEKYLKYGIKSIASFPLYKFGKVVGVFDLHSDIKNFFDKDEIKVLEEAAGDISFGIENFEKERQKEFDANNLNALINNTSDLMWSVDRNFNLITSNQPFEDMSKISFGHIIPKGGDVLSASYTPEMLKHFKGQYERAFAGEAFTETEHFDFPVEQWTEISYYPIRKGDEIIGTACHSRDITESKKAEIKIKRSEALLLESQRLAKIGSWNYDLKVDKITWSDELYNVFGIEKKTFSETYSSFIALIDEGYRELALNTNKHAQQTGEPFTIEYHITTPKGEKRIIQEHGYGEKDEQGNVVRLFGTAQDITESKLAEEEREKMTADLLQRNESLEQFTYIVSHNLRGPIANIMGTAEALRTMTLDENEKEEMLHSLSASVNKLNGVILDLNNILQVKRNVLEKREAVSFSHLIKNIRISIADQIKNEQVEIMTDFGDVDKMETIKSYLYSIFFNLVSNSIKYKQPELLPVIKIKSYKMKDKIEIHYSDNGLGIDMNKRGEQVFGLYKRFHTHIEGKGMGLFMTKTQVEALGGTISIESEVNKGTKFILQFPA